ncbi:hypothetical protein BDW59DRAFT_158253 [Aspergillus cavernicola]|uniref:Carrier domain-containing protein n=1 Tax=Aspergillus cavernicola TaxID=176166 RepID=A0ABR4ISR2_9EURO
MVEEQGLDVNLHEATLSQPLGYFVMTTTLLPYAFARYRRRLGLPASTASFSLILDARNPSFDANKVETFERNKALTLAQRQFLAPVEPAFLNNITHSASNPLPPGGHTFSGPGISPHWYNDGRVSLLMRAFADAQRHGGSNDAANPSDSTLKSGARSLRQDFDAAIAVGPAGRADSVNLVRNAITVTVAQMLFADIEGVDEGRSVTDHGVDSLIAAQLRNWFVRALGAKISMLDILDPDMSIGALSEKIVNRVALIVIGDQHAWSYHYTK